MSGEVNATITGCQNLISNLSGLQYVDPSFPGYYHTITYSEVLQALGGQVVEKFLYIGMIVLVSGLWNYFGGGDKKYFPYTMITDMINILAVVAGLVSVGFYLIFNYGGL